MVSVILASQNAFHALFSHLSSLSARSELKPKNQSTPGLASRCQVLEHLVLRDATVVTHLQAGGIHKTDAATSTKTGTNVSA